MEKKIAVVTGAGSGVGQATVIALSNEGWSVALIGRREQALNQTVELACQAVNLLVCPCDISDPQAVEQMQAKVQHELGTVELLVNAAGTNVPERSLEVLSFANYQQVVSTNLTGAYLCVQAFLAPMRKQKRGTIINIVSDAGFKASPKAGVAYVVSKFGLAGLTDAINAEERPNGIRACAIFPGEINTPLLDLRPSPPPLEARKFMLQPQDVAACVMLAVNLPQHATIEQLIVRPT